MWQKRSVQDAVLSFILWLGLLLLFAYRVPVYGRPFFGGLAVGLACGHALVCFSHEVQRVPERWKFAASIAAVVLFMGPVPAFVLRNWGRQSIEGHVFGLFTILALEMSLLSLLQIQRPDRAESGTSVDVKAAQ